MSTTRLPTIEELEEAERFFAGMGPFSWYIDPETDEFHAYIIGWELPPVLGGAKRRKAGVRPGRRGRR